MLPKSHRLTRHDLVILRRSGRRFNYLDFSLITKRTNLGHLRLGVEISTKVDKRASFRNQLRRLVFSTVQYTPLIAKPFDLLLVIKPEFKRQTDRSLRDFSYFLNNLPS